MRLLILIAFVLVPTFALAQPASASDPAALRKVCADAMNADPKFAEAIVETVNKDTALQHLRAADSIAKNEKHVLLAYGAMWAVAAAFLIFMWRRQQGLKLEIAQLKRDLEAAAK